MLFSSTCVWMSRLDRQRLAAWDPKHPIRKSGRWDSEKTICYCCRYSQLIDRLRWCRTHRAGNYSAASALRELRLRRQRCACCWHRKSCNSSVYPDPEYPRLRDHAQARYLLGCQGAAEVSARDYVAPRAVCRTDSHEEYLLRVVSRLMRSTNRKADPLWLLPSLLFSGACGQKHLPSLGSCGE